METQGTWSHNLLLDTFCSDQSLFAASEVVVKCHWLSLRGEGVCMCVVWGIQCQMSDSFI